MSIETQKHFLGKTQSILLAETKSERWISWVRLGIAVFYIIIAVIAFIFGKTSFPALAIQIFAVILLITYTIVFLFYSKTRSVNNYSIYLLITFDVTVVTLIFGSYLVDGYGFVTAKSIAFSAYFIIIIFTALHYRYTLSIYCGLISSLAFTLMYWWYYTYSSEEINWTDDYIIKLTFLLSIAVLGSIVSRNNARTIQKVVSSEIRYHNLVHRLPEMLFTLNDNGEFIWANIASHSVLGVPSKLLAGRNINSFLVRPQTIPLDGNGVKGTFEIKDCEGNQRFVDCTIQMADSQDHPTAFEGIMSDVTERELAISQREEMVNRLFQYQKMESLATLASGMAHDFNNILQTVHDLVVMVQRESREEETKKRMVLIDKTMVDAQFLISELLALGRKKPLDYNPLNMVSFMESIVGQFSSQLGSSYRVTLAVPDEELWIQGDKDYLKRVFQNLFGNAKDVMPNGGAITVSVYSYENDDDIAKLVVLFGDTGTGIPPEHMKKIFEPFFSTKSPGKGTGLGLALVHRIVMLHNGSITIEKTDTTGTTFRIELPLCNDVESFEDTRDLLTRHIETSVLLLDDDPKIRDILKIFLTEFKYFVFEATSASEAVVQLRQNKDNCRVVIMDWNLGGEDPCEVISKLRAIKEDIIVIVVSGFPPRQKEIEIMKIYKWFTKPYDKNQLDYEIQRALYCTA